MVAFGPGIVADQVTFENPHQYAVGIPLVIVNGVVTIRDGEHTGELGGSRSAGTRKSGGWGVTTQVPDGEGVQVL